MPDTSPRGNSLDFVLPDKAATYLLQALNGDYDGITREVEIFDGIKTIQPLALILSKEG